MRKVKWTDIVSQIKSRSSGEVSITCPSCSHERKKKNDRCMRVNLTKGLAFCHHCSAVSVKDESPLVTKISYKLPKQEWSNYTQMSNNIIKYFEGRGISQATLKALGVSEEKYYQPQDKSEVNNIVFNYFEGDTLVNKKFRSGAKHFTQLSNTKPIFYNINSVINSEDVYIVEGEFDVLSMHEAGFKNTISIPNGANDNDEFWINCEAYLKKVKKFYIATDNDEKGEMVADKIAQRLGRYRCERILFKNKDANGDLVSGGADMVRESVSLSKKYPSSGTFTVEDLYDDMIGFYENGMPETFAPKHPCFGNLKNIFSVMRGHLVVATGIPSHGKSNFVEWYVMNLVNDYKMKASFFSPEHHPMALHQTTFVEKFYGKNFFINNFDIPRVTKQEVKRYKDWANEKIYLTSAENGDFPTWDWLFEKFKEQMFVFGVDVFVIDAFNKLQHSNSRQNELSSIREVLTKLTLFAQINNVIIFLVAHPRKMTTNELGDYQIPTLYDVSGSADFRNQTHDGFSIYRHYRDKEVDGENIYKNQVQFFVEKIKMKFQGEMTKSETFNYDLPSGRYYVGNERPTFVFDQEDEPMVVKPKNIEEAFDTNELPF
jgi:twinkle protein